MQDSSRYGAVQKAGFRLAGGLGSLLIKSLFASSRIDTVNPQFIPDLLARDRKVIIACWHGGVIGGLGIINRLYGVRTAVMASKSKDGEYLAAFQRAMHCVPFRGSSSRGGVGAQKGMIRFMRQGGRMAANAADGPRGPRFEAKAGMISLAQLTNGVLMPASWAADRAWVFEKSWDRMQLPKPFAKISLVFEEPIEVPRRLDADKKEEYRLLLEQRLRKSQALADSMAGRN